LILSSNVSIVNAQEGRIHIFARDGNGDPVSFGGITTSRSIEFFFSSSNNDKNVIFQCGVDTSSLSHCTSLITYHNVKNSHHTFRVAPVNSDVNISPATGTWYVYERSGYFTSSSPCDYSISS
jgi:hypothetical protein